MGEMDTVSSGSVACAPSSSKRRQDSTQSRRKNIAVARYNNNTARHRTQMPGGIPACLHVHRSTQSTPARTPNRRREEDSATLPLPWQQTGPPPAAALHGSCTGTCPPQHHRSCPQLHAAGGGQQTGPRAAATAGTTPSHPLHIGLGGPTRAFAPARHCFARLHAHRRREYGAWGSAARAREARDAVVWGCSLCGYSDGAAGRRPPALFFYSCCVVAAGVTWHGARLIVRSVLSAASCVLCPVSAEGGGLEPRDVLQAGRAVRGALWAGAPGLPVRRWERGRWTGELRLGLLEGVGDRRWCCAWAVGGSRGIFRCGASLCDRKVWLGKVPVGWALISRLSWL